MDTPIIAYSRNLYRAEHIRSKVFTYVDINRRIVTPEAKSNESTA